MIAGPAGLLAAPLRDKLGWVRAMTGMTEREHPLLIFRDYVADPDLEVSRQIREQLRQRSDILARVEKKLGSGKRVRLSIEDVEVRLMFVPQQNASHTVAYHRYCKDVTDYFFAISRDDNFYTAIHSPRENYPAIPENGVSAFLVHRLAKAYRAVCRFRTKEGGSVAYRVSGAIFSNHLGAVDLEIEYLSPGRFALRRRPFTIWQNHSDLAFNLMAIPVEETLHYYLGRSTDRQIAGALKKNPTLGLEAARRLADDWMAVEESLVGGLVEQVLRGYCNDRGVAHLGLLTEVGQPQVPSLPQYRYREKGIALVRDLGLERSIAMYMDQPSAFRDRLGLGTAASTLQG